MKLLAIQKRSPKDTIQWTDCINLVAYNDTLLDIQPRNTPSDNLFKMKQVKILQIFCKLLSPNLNLVFTVYTFKSTEASSTGAPIRVLKTKLFPPTPLITIASNSTFLAFVLARRSEPKIISYVNILTYYRS